MYIGQTTIMKKRWMIHKSELRGNYSINNLLQNDWNQHGEESFEFTVIEECPRDKLDEREVYWINHYKTSMPEHGYNKELGGKKGCTPWNKGIPCSFETRLKISKSNKGKTISEESKCKMLKSHRSSFIRTRNTSGYKGVSYFKTSNKWRATIVISKKQVSLGYYTSKEEAALAYNKAASFYFGENAYLNRIAI